MKKYTHSELYIAPAFLASFFGLGALAFAFELFDRRIVISIGHEGITSRYLNNQYLAYSAIKSANILRLQGAVYLRLQLHDPSQYIRTGIRGVLGRLQGKMGLGDIDLPIIGLDHSAKEIAARCQAAMQAAASHVTHD